MSSFLLIRGWFEVEFGCVQRMKESLAEFVAANSTADKDVVALIAKRWTFPDTPLNWVSVVTFGASINQRDQHVFQSMASVIANSGQEVFGYFWVDGEEDGDSFSMRFFNSQIEIGKALERPHF